MPLAARMPRCSLPNEPTASLEDVVPLILSRSKSFGELPVDELEDLNIPILELLRSNSEEPMSPPPRRRDKDKRVYSFAACGWLKLYYFGVAKKLQEEGMVQDAKFMGSSAGSLVSAALALDLDFDKIREFQMSCVDRTHGTFLGAFKLRTYVHEICDSMLPHNAADVLNNRCEISITTLPWLRNKRVKIYSDNAHIRQALAASCCMAPLAGLPFMFDGSLVFDGALSDWLMGGFLRGPQFWGDPEPGQSPTITGALPYPPHNQTPSHNPITVNTNPGFHSHEDLDPIPQSRPFIFLERTSSLLSMSQYGGECTPQAGRISSGSLTWATRMQRHGARGRSRRGEREKMEASRKKTICGGFTGRMYRSGCLSLGKGALSLGCLATEPS